MREGMSSRERLLTAINHEEPDRVPICFRGVAPLDRRWKSRFQRVLGLLELGADDKVVVSPPWPYHPDVKVRQWRDTQADPRYPIMLKELETPRGALRLAVRETFDWRPRDLPLVADHNWSRATEFLVKDEADLERLEYLLPDPRSGDLTAFEESARAAKEFCRKHEVLFEASIQSPSNVALNLMGPQPMMIAAADSPDLVERLLERLQTWAVQGLELVLDAEVDTVYHTACYETTALWSPAMYERLFAPLVRETTRIVHEGGAKFHYYMDTGARPVFERFPELGVDIWSTVAPPPMGDVELSEAKRKIGDRVCLWGGVDTPHVIERGTPAEVREAVRTAIEAGAPGGGFVLSTADSVWRDDVLENVMAFLEAGREFGAYRVGQ